MTGRRYPSRRETLAAAGGAAAAAGIGAGAAEGATALPPGAVMRVSRGTFDAADFERVDRVVRATEGYLVPAISALPGLIAYYAGTSPDGVTTQISIWTSQENAQLMGELREMTERARGEALAAGIAFEPIRHFPVAWSILT